MRRSPGSSAVGSVEWIPVAAPGHPLALAGRNAPGAGRHHIQLVLTDRSQLTKRQDFGVIATENWRLADLGSKHMLLKEGIGWAICPNQWCARISKEGASFRSTCPGCRGDPSDCMQFTGRIARRAPGSFLGSRPRRQGRPNPLINPPPFLSCDRCGLTRQKARVRRSCGRPATRQAQRVKPESS